MEKYLQKGKLLKAIGVPLLLAILIVNCGKKTAELLMVKHGLKIAGSIMAMLM